MKAETQARCSPRVELTSTTPSKKASGRGKRSKIIMPSPNAACPDSKLRTLCSTISEMPNKSEKKTKKTVVFSEKKFSYNV